MAELIAQSDNSNHRWRRRLDREVPVWLGRSGSWSVPWDGMVSRRHARLVWNGEHLQVERLPEAGNPIFHRGQRVDDFSLTPGDFFVIGETTFTLAQSAVGATMQMPDPAREQLFSRQVLNEVKFRDAEKRLAILSDMPSLIEGAKSDQELLIRLVNVIFGGVDRAISVAVVEVPAEGQGERRSVEVLHWDRRFAQGESFQPSQRLIQSAVQKQQSVLHIWEDPQALEALTVIDGAHDWAFVTPVASVEPQGRKLAIYVSGLLTSGRQPVDSISSIASSLKEDIKFTELAASIAGSLVALQQVRDAQLSLRSNVPASLWHVWQDSESTANGPNWQELTCVFCRWVWPGRPVERESEWETRFRQASRLSQAMSAAMLQRGGVLGASRGETVMGFWGWPVLRQQPATEGLATALELVQQWEGLASWGNADDQPPTLQIGVVTGMGMAGTMGAGQWSKPTVLGPVVDRGHDLSDCWERCDSKVHSAIVLDGATRQRVWEESQRIADGQTPTATTGDSGQSIAASDTVAEEATGGSARAARRAAVRTGSGNPPSERWGEALCSETIDRLRWGMQIYQMEPVTRPVPVSDSDPSGDAASGRAGLDDAATIYRLVTQW